MKNLARIRFLIPFMLLFVLTSCAQKEASWAGTYKGVLPCVNCEGLEAILTLKEDTTFLLKINFLGSDVTIPDTTGNVIWNEPNKLFTLDIKSYFSSQFEIAGDTLINLGLDGARVVGSDANKFIFKRQ
ncbi:MAG: copper resistance protein NlpE N-terminal domain-containing protein [Saprospiraceae bacterium]|nr:copper resistance protein NlpE N-terminal domain-containing protein [Saprospiraceae bacterium]